MSRHYTPSAIAAMPIDERCYRLNVAVGHVELVNAEGDPVEWWLPFTDPVWQKLRHWITLDPWPPWQGVYARYQDAPGPDAPLDDAYSRVGVQRDWSLTAEEAVTWLLDHIDSTGWQPAGE